MLYNFVFRHLSTTSLCPIYLNSLSEVVSALRAVLADHSDVVADPLRTLCGFFVSFVVKPL